MEAPSAPSTSQTYPTEAARRTAFTEEITPELVWPICPPCTIDELVTMLYEACLVSSSQAHSRGEVCTLVRGVVKLDAGDTLDSPT